MIDHTQLELPEEAVPFTGEAVPVPDEGPSCVACKTKLDFTPDAAEVIAIRRICEVSQTIITCPFCSVRMVVFPAGGVPVEPSETEVVVGPPALGWRIARVA